ncbi:response regulator transcription factor [Aliarcobacter lanthieri]|uniref:response regulator transcription factor n=1 Tax=Aliarcobacter lanthieri TaxID=1355374 RepID=UPI003AAFE630
MKKIFLLEDDYSLNDTIKDMLEKSSFIVNSFYNGEEAFDNILGDYSLYILDINVPNIDGITILEKIKSINPNAKVIIISANIDIDKITEAYEKDCDDYIKNLLIYKNLDLK